MRSSQGKKNLIYGVIILLVIGSIWMVISPDFKSHLNKQGATSRAEYPSVDENRAGPSQSSPVTGSPGATSKVIQNQNVQGAQSSPVAPVVPVQGQATRPVSASRVGTPAGAVQNGVTQGVGAPVGAVQGVATLLGGPQALVKV